jgi:hypothetical protein
MRIHISIKIDDFSQFVNFFAVKVKICVLYPRYARSV